MRQHIIAGFIILYASMAIATFGHAAAAAKKDAEISEAKCEAKGQSRYCNGAIEAPPLNGLFAAVVWPLYWSWELQE